MDWEIISAAILPNYSLSIEFKACTNQVQNTFTEKGGSEKTNRSILLDSWPEMCIVEGSRPEGTIDA